VALSNIISVSCISGAYHLRLFVDIYPQLVDEMAVIVRDLCGEKTFRGFDDLQRDFLGREEKAIGDGFFEKMP